MTDGPIKPNPQPQVALVEISIPGETGKPATVLRVTPQFSRTAGLADLATLRVILVNETFEEIQEVSQVVLQLSGTTGKLMLSRKTTQPPAKIPKFAFRKDCPPTSMPPDHVMPQQSISVEDTPVAATTVPSPPGPSILNRPSGSAVRRTDSVDHGHGDPLKAPIPRSIPFATCMDPPEGN